MRGGSKPHNDDRIKEKLEKYRRIDNGTGCWIWLSDLLNGYGITNYKGKPVYVHRLSMHLFRGFDLDSGLEILHKAECKSRRCFNPDHLYDGTQQDNMRDMSKSIT